MKKKLLLLTNLENGYPEEDQYLADYFRKKFDVNIGHVPDYEFEADGIDGVFIGNTWPHEENSPDECKEYDVNYEALIEQVRQSGLPVYNPLSGAADFAGKKYLINLHDEGYPVIPSVFDAADMDRLPASKSEKYILKPEFGYSSVGIKYMTMEKILAEKPEGYVIQPFVDFVHEMSFVYIDQTYQYTLYAPDKAQRWELEVYEPSRDELAFAEKFVKWNTMPYGLQRVDACKMRDGSLLLIELEDKNPHLGFHLLSEENMHRFLDDLVMSVGKHLFGE